VGIAWWMWIFVGVSFAIPKKNVTLLGVFFAAKTIELQERKDFLLKII